MSPSSLPLSLLLSCTSLVCGCDHKAHEAVLLDSNVPRVETPIQASVQGAPEDSADGVKKAPSSEELELLHAYEVHGPSNFQPSGLLLHEGHLLTVSDKHDHAIYELVFQPGRQSVVAKIWRQWVPPNDAVGKMDFEGISRDLEGNILLVSEERSRVLVVPPSGPVRWQGPSLAPLAAQVGLFAISHARFEGITLLPQGGLLLAAELGPRGLVEIPPAAQHLPNLAWTLDRSDYPIPHSDKRHLDFTDLTMNEGKIFALCRSSHLIVDMVRNESGWHEGRAWSFSATENNQAYLYKDSIYGRAEGLEIEADRLFVILDNNGDGRMAEGKNKSPLLFEFRRPLDL